MAKQKHSNQPKQFDVHRTLPRNPSHLARQGSDFHSKKLEAVGAPIEPETPEKKRRFRFTWKRLVAGFLLLVLGFFLFIGIWDARNFSHASSKMFGSGNLLKLLSSSSLKGSDQNRVNVLIAGYSADDPGHQGANLTDSIMLLSMSTTNHTGYMLSIPRDLYVSIPGFGHHKINQAYQDGGMGLLEQTVSNSFNVPIDYYALVDYGAVRGIVDALGGVTVNIQSTDPRGFYDPSIDYSTNGPLVQLSNGPHALDGEQALDLTRARGDAAGSYGYGLADFTRTQNQRLVFSAIKAKSSNWKLVLDPRKNGKIFNALADNVKTDVQLSEVRPLYQLFKGIPDSQMQSISLNKLNGKNFLGSEITSDGDSLVPAAGTNDFSDIQAAISQLNQQ